MDKRIEELRAQRELIQKHLDWLDRQLAESENRNQTESIPPVKATDSTSEAIHLSDKPPEETKIEEPSILEEPSPNKLVAPVQNDIRRASIGCLVTFILATSLFLFLLFGLPYLLD